VALLASSVVTSPDTNIEAKVAPQMVDRHVKRQKDRLWGLAISQDGSAVYSGSLDGTIVETSVRSGEATARHENGHGILCLVLSTDGQWLFVASNDGKIRKRSVTTGHVAREYVGHEDRVRSMALSEDGKSLFSGCLSCRLLQFSVETGTIIREFKTLRSAAMSMALVGDRSIICGCRDAIREFSLRSGELMREIRGHTDWVRAVVVSKDRKSLFSAARDASIREWSLETGQQVRQFDKGHTKSIRSLALSRDGLYLFSASSDCTVRQWSTRLGQELVSMRLTLGASGVLAVSLAPDGSYVASTCEDGSVCFWALTPSVTWRVYKDDARFNWKLSVLPEGRFSICGTYATFCREWAYVDPQPLMLDGALHTAIVRSLAVSSDGQHIISASDDKTVRVFNSLAPKQARIFKQQKLSIRSVAIVPDGSSFVSASDDATICHWSLKDGSLLRTFEVQIGSLRSVVVADGDTFFTASDTCIRQWSLTSGSMVSEIMCAKVTCLAVGTGVLYSGGTDRVLRQWSISSGKCLWECKDHTDAITCLTLTSDGGSLVTGTRDGFLRVIDAQKGKTVQSCKTPSGFFQTGIQCLDVTRDGKSVLVGSSDKTVRQWTLALDLILEVNGFRSGVSALSFLPDNTAVLGFEDGSLRLFSLNRVWSS